MRNSIHLLMLTLLSCVIAPGCSLFRSLGEDTSGLFTKMTSSNVKRKSVLDDLENEEPDYLLDTLMSRSKEKNPELHQQNGEKARRLFAEAEELYQKGIAVRESNREGSEHVQLLTSAAKTYLKASEFWINSTMEQDALFKAGESYYFANHLKKSNEVFERLIKDYDGTRHMDVAQARRFKIAEYWLQLADQKPQNPVVLNLSDESRPLRDTKGNAIRVLNRIRLDDTSGKLADDATMALANAYFDQKKYLDAADTYEDLRVNFPNSKHQFNAHLFEMKSRLQAYQGAHYDGTHLDTADKLIKAIMVQFPTEADEHSELLTTENARIRKMKGERQLAVAEYYEARGAYKAAGMHYQELLADYRGTPLSDDAQQRLAKIADKPSQTNEPPTWVAKIFPEPKAAEPLFGTSLKDQIR